MRRVKQIWQWMRSTASKMWQQAGSSMKKIASLPNKAKLRQADDLIPPLAVVMGAAAFGFWQHSITAAIFAVAGLFLLAGIHNSTQRILTTLRHSDPEPHFDNLRARVLAEPTAENTGPLNQAISSLKPWLANEVSLTEENAKECCAVLVDSLAQRARAATAANSR